MPQLPFVVLAAGRAQVPLLRRAVDLGLETWVFDQDPDAPGRELAARFAAVSVRHADAVLARLRPWASEQPPRGVLSGSAAPGALLSAAMIAGSYELPGPSLEAVKRVLDRGAQRAALELARVPVPDGGIYLGVAEAARAARRIGDAVLKPGSGTSGSAGVVFVGPKSDVELWAAGTARAGDGRVVVEAVVQGMEMSIDAVVHAGEVSLLSVTRKETSLEQPLPAGYRTPVGPAPSRSAAREVAELVVAALGIDHTALSIDVVWTDDGPVVLEAGLFVDAKIDRMLAFAGRDVYGALVGVATGEAVQDLPEFARGTALRFLYASEPSPLDASRMAEAEEVVRRDGGRLEWQRSPGEVAATPHSLADTLGWILCTGLDGDAAWRRAMRLEDEVLGILSLGS